MVRQVLKFFFVCVFLAATGSVLRAQTFEETMQKLSLDAAKAYVNPIVSGFGTDLNGGWFHRAPRATMLGFDLEFGVVGMGTFFKDENKSFSSSGTFSFTQAQAQALTDFVNSDASIPAPSKAVVQNYLVSQITQVPFTLSVSGPTVVGSKTDSVKIQFNSKTYNVPGYGQVTVPGQYVALPVVGFLQDLKALPLAAPQLSIGTFVGTQFTFRYLPSQDIKDLGKATYFGWGIQHNPGIWFGAVDALPVDLSLSFFTQKIKFGDLFQSKATEFGVNVSKRLGWGFLNLTPYAGFMFESSTMSFAYNFYAPDPSNNYQPTKLEQVSFDLDSANKSRLVLGLSIKLLFVNVNADYNFGKYNSATAGVMFII